jgi:hypothetical protein
MEDAKDPSAQPPVGVSPQPVEEEPSTEAPTEVQQDAGPQVGTKLMPTPAVPSPTEAPTEVQQKPEPRIRKVRVNAPAPAPAPAQPPPHVYWPSRLQEHRDAQRAAKDERYSNLRIY